MRRRGLGFSVSSPCQGEDEGEGPMTAPCAIQDLRLAAGILDASNPFEQLKVETGFITDREQSSALRATLRLILGAGVTPAQGGAEPTEGSAFNQALFGPVGIICQCRSF